MESQRNRLNLYGTCASQGKRAIEARRELVGGREDMLRLEGNE